MNIHTFHKGMSGANPMCSIHQFLKAPVWPVSVPVRWHIIYHPVPLTHSTIILIILGISTTVPGSTS